MASRLTRAKRSGSSLSTSVPPLRALARRADATRREPREQIYLDYLAAAGSSASTCSSSGRAAEHDATLRDEVTELLQELIRARHRQPAGERDAAAELLREYLEANGVECELYARVPGAGEPRRAAPGHGDGPRLLLLSHTDTVLADPAEWSVDPWSGELRDGRSGVAARST